ncbi:MAG: hypothetical protein LBE89_03960 [Helicobacteraceae bacterium]|nr:hypothetical protein [Helicobacteraceae bacterium]
MIKAENFICFLTSCGFFVGVIFSLLADFEPLMFVAVSIAMCVIFYTISLASASFFIRAIDIKAAYVLDREHYETQLDKVRLQIEKREKYIRDSTRFIEALEDEITKAKERAEIE